MIIKYADKKTERVCNDEKYARKKFPPSTCKELQKLMVYLSTYDTLDYFRKLTILRKYRYHELQGKEKGIISLYIDYQYRMELKLKVEKIDGQDVILILEVSNHYGD